MAVVLRCEGGLQHVVVEVGDALGIGEGGGEGVDARFESAEGAPVVPVDGYYVRADCRLVLELARRWTPRCPYCMTLCRKVHERCPPRRWQDLPWAGRGVVLEFAPIRVWCPRCE